MAGKPIWAAEKTAAELLDMKPSEFRRLVDEGHLPRPSEIVPGVPRWCTDQLRAIGRGDAIDGGIDW